MIRSLKRDDAEKLPMLIYTPDVRPSFSLPLLPPPPLAFPLLLFHRYFFISFNWVLMQRLYSIIRSALPYACQLKYSPL